MFWASFSLSSLLLEDLLCLVMLFQSLLFQRPLFHLLIRGLLVGGTLCWKSCPSTSVVFAAWTNKGKLVCFFAPSLTVTSAHSVRRSEGSAALGEKLVLIVKQDVQAGCRNWEGSTWKQVKLNWACIREVMFSSQTPPSVNMWHFKGAGCFRSPFFFGYKNPHYSLDIQRNCMFWTLG